MSPGLDAPPAGCQPRVVPVEPLRINPRITIPSDELRLTYVRSGGPGGQNVNKVATKAVLRFNLRESPSIPEPARSRAQARLKPRLTSAGDIVLSSSVHRDQARNREAVLDRLALLLAGAVREPHRRVPTSPTRTARERRLAEKKARGQLKQGRRIAKEESPA
jgi:ribosome-associated protein